MRTLLSLLVCKDPVSKQGHVPRSWGLRPQRVKSGDTIQPVTVMVACGFTQLGAVFAEGPLGTSLPAPLLAPGPAGDAWTLPGSPSSWPCQPPE